MKDNKETTIRLDKYLANMQVGSRSDVKKMIRKGLVTVDGEIVKSPEEKVNTNTSVVVANGKTIGYAQYEYYMLNKPAGVVSATEDRQDTTVVDLIKDKKRKDLFPVGRLDKDTEGLLLITNDGALAHNLLAPGKHVDKTYLVKIDGIVTEEDVDIFAKGIDIGTSEEPEVTLPAKLVIDQIDKEANQSFIRLTIQEGKFHQVKRMFAKVGKPVTYLKRLSMGELQLDEKLGLGEYRFLTKEELDLLKK